MNTEEYLARINYFGKTTIEITTLTAIHQHHVLEVPFENLDVQNGIKIQLDIPQLFQKIITKNRGGFCYELNYLFMSLLKQLGFEAHMISASIFDDDKLGPAFDHMAVAIYIENEYWIADVGFGDLFIKPLKIKPGTVQYDGVMTFKIDSFNSTSYLLSKSEDGIHFEKKYVFDLNEKRIEQFFPQCELKQQSPTSYFVQNKVCTLAQKNGRVTIFNSKFIQKKKGHKTAILIENKAHENQLLMQEFNIVL